MKTPSSSGLESLIQKPTYTVILAFLGSLFALLSVLSFSVRFDSFNPPILVSSALPFSLPLLAISVILFSLLLAFTVRPNLAYMLSSAIQLTVLHLAALSNTTILLHTPSFSLVTYNEGAQHIFLTLPATIYFSSWLRATRKFSSLRECLPALTSAFLLLTPCFYSTQPLVLTCFDATFSILPGLIPPSVATGAILTASSTLIGLSLTRKASKRALVLTSMPALFIALSGSPITKKAASVTGYYDHVLHSLFPPHFNVFAFLSLFFLMNGLLLLSSKKAEKLATLLCIFLAISYPALHRAMTRLLVPVALDPAPLVWLSVAFVAPVFLYSRFSAKSFLLAVILAALALQPIGVARISEVTSIPVIPVGRTGVDGRIDPSILTITQPPEEIPVILYFPHPVSEEALFELNALPFFEVSKHNGTPAVYNSHVGFVYGVIKASLHDWRDASRLLVEKFNLRYLLLDRGIDPSQLLIPHPITCSVDADVLHALNLTGRGVTVAIIDSGINDLDPEIAGKTEGRIIYQVNLITGKEGDPLTVGDLTPADSKLHGTFVARTIAGVRGIAPHANIIDLKVQVETGEMCYADSLRVVEAIEWCIRNKERFNISVINLSMGNREGGKGIVCSAVERASLAGIVVVAAAGSYSNPLESCANPVFTPGVSSRAVTVGATQSYIHDFWACFPASAVGDWAKLKPDLVAPGPYTSGSTPVVAGIAALLFQAAENLGLPKNVRSIAVKHALLSGAAQNDLGMPGFDPLYGYGKANALASYLALKNFS